MRNKTDMYPIKVIIFSLLMIVLVMMIFNSIDFMFFRKEFINKFLSFGFYTLKFEDKIFEFKAYVSFFEHIYTIGNVDKIFLINLL